MSDALIPINILEFYFYYYVYLIYYYVFIYIYYYNLFSNNKLPDSQQLCGELDDVYGMGLRD